MGWHSHSGIPPKMSSLQHIKMFSRWITGLPSIESQMRYKFKLYTVQQHQNDQAINQWNPSRVSPSWRIIFEDSETKIKHPSKMTTKLYSRSSSWAVIILWVLDSPVNDLLRKEGIWFIVLLSQWRNRLAQERLNLAAIWELYLNRTSAGEAVLLKPFMVVIVYCNWSWA